MLLYVSYLFISFVRFGSVWVLWYTVDIHHEETDSLTAWLTNWRTDQLLSKQANNQSTKKHILKIQQKRCLLYKWKPIPKPKDPKRPFGVFITSRPGLQANGRQLWHDILMVQLCIVLTWKKTLFLFACVFVPKGWALGLGWSWEWWFEIVRTSHVQMIWAISVGGFSARHGSCIFRCSALGLVSQGFGGLVDSLPEESSWFLRLWDAMGCYEGKPFDHNVWVLIFPLSNGRLEGFLPQLPFHQQEKPLGLGCFGKKLRTPDHRGSGSNNEAAVCWCCSPGRSMVFGLPL